MTCCRKRYPFDYFFPPYTISLNYPEGERPTVFMRDEYIDVWFYGLLAERHVDGLVYQYDKGLILNVRGLDTELVNKFQFTRDGVVIDVTPDVLDPTEEENYEDTDAEKLEPEEMKYLQAAIPDEMLETPGTLTVYLVYDETDKFRTVKTIYITVHPRAKVTEDDEETTTCCDRIDALTEQIAALAEKVDALGA